MDHLVPWIVVAVLLFGGLRRLARGLRGVAAPRVAPAAQPASQVGQAGQKTAWQARNAPIARAAAQPSPAPRPAAAPVRATPRPAGPTQPGDAGRAVAAALGDRARLRTAIVVAELLAPPVALR